MADQALSSLSNFALSVLVARGSTPEEFGQFTLVLSFYLLVQSASRALGSEPLLVRFSAEFRADAGAAATGLAVAVGGGAAAAAALMAAFAPKGMTGLLVGTALILPGLLLQDAWRFVFFAQGRPRRAVANDFVWLAFQAAAFSWLFLSDRVDALSLWLGWGFGATVAALFGCLQSGIRPKLSAGPRWLAQHGELAFRYLAEAVAVIGGAQVVYYSVGLVSGLAALGALRSAQLVFGPIQMGLTATVSVAVPEGVRLAEQRPDAVPKAYVALALVLAVSCAAWGAAAVAVPEAWGVALLGENWAACRPVLPALAASTALAAFGVATLCLLRVDRAAAASLRARTVAALLHVLGATTGALLDGARGAAIGLAVTNLLMVGVWLPLARDALRSVRERQRA